MTISTLDGDYFVAFEFEGRDVGLAHRASVASFDQRMELVQRIIRETFAAEVAQIGTAEQFAIQYLIVGARAGKLMLTAERGQLAGELIQFYLWKVTGGRRFVVPGSQLTLCVRTVDGRYDTEVRVNQIARGPAAMANLSVVA